MIILRKLFKYFLVFLLFSCEENNVKQPIKKNNPNQKKESTLILNRMPKGKEIKDEIGFHCLKDNLDIIKNNGFAIYRRDYTFDTIINTSKLSFYFSRDFMNSNLADSVLLYTFNDILKDANKYLFDDTTKYDWVYHYKSRITQKDNNKFIYTYEYFINTGGGSSMIKKCELLLDKSHLNEVSSEIDVSSKKYEKYITKWELH